MRLRSLLALGVVVALAGCGGTGEEGVPQDLDAGPTVGADAGEAGATQTCENPLGGWSVTFPGDWQTNTSEVIDACSVFDPEPIVLPEAGEIPPDLAVAMTREAVPFAEATQQDAGAAEEISSEEVTVGGRQALRVESRATGEGLLDAGTVTYTYYVDAGTGATIVARTHDVEGTDYDRNRRVLDEMMDSLVVFDFS